MRKQYRGVCDKCDADFDYILVHNGFNDSAYAYCRECGCVAILNGYCDQIPDFIDLAIHQPIHSAIEPYLETCQCGGRFRSNATPCCPACKERLSPNAARAYIELNAIGTENGFRWQNNWDGLYCMIVNNSVVYDNWNRRNAT